MSFYATVILADTHYVRPPPCTNTDLQSPYTSWDTAATNIQWAVNAASGGETVWVSNGTYCLTNQIEITNNITVQSTNGYSNTLVYAGWPTWTTRCFYVVNTGILDGFSISNGHFIHTNAPANGGGGAYAATNGKIQNCYFVNNVSSNGGYRSGGGGVCVQNSGIVSNCTFYSNSVYKYVTGSYTGNGIIYGGGIFMMGSVSVLDCTVVSNRLINARGGGGIGQAVSGGAMISNCFVACNDMDGFFSDSACNIIDCVISNNSSYGAWLEGCGFPKAKNCLFINNGSWGVFCDYGKNTLTNCVIVGNRSGGIYIRPYAGVDYSTVDRCVISNNVRSGSGAGVSIEKGGTLRNCLICNNTNSSASAYGGGVYLTNVAAVEAGTTHGVFNCTIGNNYSAGAGGGIAAAGTNYIVNCVIASNRTAGNSYSNIYNLDNNNSNYYYNCCAPVTNTDLFAPNQGNITNDPSFVNSSAGNWRLSANSPCLNTGTNMSWMMNLYDLDGRARIRYRRVDMGAYETIYDGTIFTVP